MTPYDTVGTTGCGPSRRCKHLRTSGTDPLSRMPTMSSEATGSATKRRGPRALPNLMMAPHTRTLTEPSACEGGVMQGRCVHAHARPRHRHDSSPGPGLARLGLAGPAYS